MPRYYRPKVNKFITLTASMPVALSAGLAYSFGIWSPALQKAYNLDQRALAVIGSACNIGGYMSIISGLLYDALDRRQHVGPRLTLIFGGIINAVGFGLLWAAITQRIRATVVQLAVFAAIAGLGGTFFDTAAVSTNLRNFPANRGTVLGIIKSGVGLSASVYTAAYSGLFQPRADHFILFLAVVPSLVSLVGLLFINHVPFIQRSEIDREQSIFSTEGRFWFLLNSVGALALYLMAAALVEGLTDVSGTTRSILAAGSVVLLLPLLLTSAGSGGLFAEKAPEELQRVASVLDADLGHDNDDDDGSEGDYHHSTGGGDVLLETGATEEPLLRGQDSLEGAEQQRESTVPMPHLIVTSIGPATALCRVNFWLLAIVCGVGIGCGLAFLNNLAQLVQALGGPDEARGVLVSLFGVANCAGRLLFGAWPERLLHTYGTPRPAFLVFSGLLTCAVYAGMAFASVPVLYALSLAAGLSFGAHWTLMPALSSELFGLESFASIYTMLQLSPATSGYALSTGMVWELYKAALRRHGASDKDVCIGSDCFRAAFLCMSGLAAMSTVLSLVLMVRTASLYRAEALALRRIERSLSGRLEPNERGGTL
jgi:MFS family permease